MKRINNHIIGERKEEMAKRREEITKVGGLVVLEAK